MNFKTLAYSLFAVLFLISCDNDTSGLGASLTPESDVITVKDDSCFATSSTIYATDLLAMTSKCNLGRFTEQNSGATFEASYLTQIGCMENIFLADSVYGIGDHKFPEWFNQAVADLKPYYANLKLYYSGFFGDSANPMKIEVFPLDRMIDANTTYYPTSVDPTQFYDANAKPLASVTVSGWNLQDHDTTRYKSTYYPSITVPLPDSIAKMILESYFNPATKHYFADATSFMENLIKGFYIRCSQGDGTMFYIDRTILQVTFRHIGRDKNGNPKLESPVAEFSGNSEVLQVNSLKWTGLESQIDNDSCTWIRSPFGVLTEITLPIDSMRDDSYVLNSALLRLSTATTPSSRFKPSAPYRLLLIRKDEMKKFFSKNSAIDNIESFVSIYSSKYGTYTYNNIAALVEKIYSDRTDWLESHNMTLQDGGQAAYESERPDWNKVVLIPVVAHLDSRNSPISYYLDLNMHQAKFIGGNKLKLKIKTVRSKF